MLVIKLPRLVKSMKTLVGRHTLTFNYSPISAAWDSMSMAWLPKMRSHSGAASPPTPTSHSASRRELMRMRTLPLM